MSKKSYFTVVLPLSDAAQELARQASSRNTLRAPLWSMSAQRMTALLGKTCTKFSPAVMPMGCAVPLPFGVALGAVEPREFLMCYFSAKNAQEQEISARSQRLQATGQTLFSQKVTESIEVTVVAVDGTDPVLNRELELAGRFFNGDITAAGGLYYLGFDQCQIDGEMEDKILANPSEYAVCVAELEV